MVAETLEDDFGHGLIHAVKVSHDAGTLMVIEARQSGYDEDPLSRLVCLVQTAGLLHDIKRKTKDHSSHAAAHAKKLLRKYPFSAEEIKNICAAIQNHEAFKDPLEAGSPEAELISNCLYDADKFRWGPDNFHDTLWDMVSYFNPPLAKFMDGYPQGMEKLKTIKTTFRTVTGKIRPSIYRSWSGDRRRAFWRDQIGVFRIFITFILPPVLERFVLSCLTPKTQFTI